MLPGFPTMTLRRASGTTLNLAIVNNADDDSEFFGSLQGGETMTAGFISGFVTSSVGVRFVNVTIQQGASIQSALLTLEATNITGSPDLNVFGVDEDDVSQWSDGDISGATTTTAVTNITPSSTGPIQVDVTAQVQEIVNRGGFTSGNALAFVILDNAGTGDNNASFEALEAGNGNEATLDIIAS